MYEKRNAEVYGTISCGYPIAELKKQALDDALSAKILAASTGV